MKVTLPESFIKSINEKIFKSVLKILEVRNNSTLIDIKGHQFDVPFVLKKDTKYHAVIKDGILNIIELKKTKDQETEKNAVKDILENIFQINEKNNDNFFFNPVYFLKNMINRGKDKKKNNYFFRDKNGGLVFIFDIYLYDKSVRLFLRFIQKSIFLFFYTDELSEHIMKDFSIGFEKFLYENYKEMIFEIKFFDKKEKFYDNISILTSNIDIKI